MQAARVFGGKPDAREKDVGAALTEPSIYDESLSLLARRGFPVPEDKLTRDFSQPYVSDPRVTDAWRLVYRASDVEKHWDVYELAEKLVDVEYRISISGASAI